MKTQPLNLTSRGAAFVAALALASFAPPAGAQPTSPDFPQVYTPGLKLGPQAMTRDRLEYDCKVVRRDAESGSFSFVLAGRQGYATESGSWFTPRSFLKRTDTLDLLGEYRFSEKWTRDDDQRLFFEQNGQLFGVFLGRSWGDDPKKTQYISVSIGKIRSGNLAYPILANGYCEERRIPQKPLSPAEARASSGK